jgi:hypothetical protein
MQHELVAELASGTAARNGRDRLIVNRQPLRWVHVTLDDGRLPQVPPGGLSAIKYAVDHDLVVTIRFRILSQLALLVVQA